MLSWLGKVFPKLEKGHEQMAFEGCGNRVRLGNTSALLFMTQRAEFYGFDLASPLE